MLTITQLLNGQLSIKADYFYRNRIKDAVPSALFDQNTKQWIVPFCTLGLLEKEFQGELVYKTPRWVMLNQPMPDMSAMYKISDSSIKSPVLKLKPYDYQDYGIRFMIDKILKRGFVLNADDVGLGKCHGKGTKILMADGTIKNVEDIKVGERLMGDDGTPRNVLSLAHGQEQMYKITLRNGDSFTCNESHILSLQVSAGNRYKQYRGGDIVNISIKDYLQLPEWVKEKVLKAYKKPIDNFGWNNHGFDIEPYMYGLWLGDGNSRHFSFTINNNDTEVIQYIKNYAVKHNLEIREANENGDCTTYHLHKGTANSLPYKELNLVHVSAHNGKHVFPTYKYADGITRLQVLAGLLDTDGHLVDNVYEITTKFEELKEDILFIARSLGFSVSWSPKIVNKKTYYRIFISGDTDTIPVLLPRKKATLRKQKKNPLLYSFTVEPLGMGDYYGFTLDGNHLYLLGDFTVTHNTIQTIATIKWFIENRGVEKVLIICKKSIKKQWLDEIHKFTDIGQSFKMYRTGSTAAQRKKAYDDFNKAQKGILVTNYHSFLNDTSLFQNMKIDFVVIDEVHSVKARTGKLNNNIAKITTGKPTVFLTGTPIMSRPEDIFGIVQMVDPSYFGKWTTFQKEFLTMDYNGRFGVRVVGAKNLDKLRALVQDIVIRRTEYEVSIQLPKTVMIKKDCQMDATQEKILMAIAEKTEDIANQLDSIKKSNMPEDIRQEKLLQLDGQSKGLIAARQAASTDPRLFLTSTSKMMRDTFGKMIPASYKMSDKTESILDTVQDIVDNSEKVILFTKFRTCATMIANDIQNILKESVLLYTGAEDDAAREQAVDYFKNTSTYDILIGTEAMAEGLNLQCAKYVINIDQPDTLAIKTQRIGRARRAGSVYNNVVVFDMITNSTSHAKSKDEERLENIANNADLTDALVSIDDAQRKALIDEMGRR